MYFVSPEAVRTNDAKINVKTQSQLFTRMPPKLQGNAILSRQSWLEVECAFFLQ